LFLAALIALAGCSSQPGPQLAHGKSVEHWVRELKSDDAKARKRAAEVLGNVGPADSTVVPALAGAARDRDRNVREAVVVALLKMGDAAADATPALVEASKDSDARVRSQALKALERIRTKT
jgi:HEAT repeat protein